MTEDEHDLLTPVLQDFEPCMDETSANAFSLVLGQYRQRRKRNGRQRATVTLDRHAREKDMTNNLRIQLGHEGKQNNSLGPQSLD